MFNRIPNLISQEQCKLLQIKYRTPMGKKVRFLLIPAAKKYCTDYKSYNKNFFITPHHVRNCNRIRSPAMFVMIVTATAMVFILPMMFHVRSWRNVPRARVYDDRDHNCNGPRVHDYVHVFTTDIFIIFCNISIVILFPYLHLHT